MMSRIVVLSLCLFVKLNQSFGGKEFCDKSLENNLMTGVMNYDNKSVLLFRGNQTWRAIHIKDPKLSFLEPKFKQQLIGPNIILKSGFVITKRPKCDPNKDQICREMLNLTMIFYDNPLEDNNHYYRVFKPSSDGFLKDWNQSQALPYNWNITGNQSIVSLESDISGAAFISNKISLRLYFISSDSLKTLAFINTQKLKTKFETNFSKYNKIIGGFELNNLPYFVTNNKICEYNPVTNAMRFITTSWNAFCGKSVLETNTDITETSSETITIPSTLSDIVNTETTAQDSNGLIILLILGFILVVIFGLIIGGIVFWFSKKSEKKKRPLILKSSSNKSSNKSSSGEDMECTPSTGFSVKDNHKNKRLDQREEGIQSNAVSEVDLLRPTELNVKKK